MKRLISSTRSIALFFLVASFAASAYCAPIVVTLTIPYAQVVTGGKSFSAPSITLTAVGDTTAVVNGQFQAPVMISIPGLTTGLVTDLAAEVSVYNGGLAFRWPIGPGTNPGSPYPGQGASVADASLLNYSFTDTIVASGVNASTYTPVIGGSGSVSFTLIDGRKVSATARASNASLTVLVVDAKAPSTVVEFYNATLDHYLMSWQRDEIESLDRATEIQGWVRTGYSFNAFTGPEPGTSMIFRLYIPPELGDSYFFCRNAEECGHTLANFPSFRLSGVIYMYVPNVGTCPVNSMPVYRVFSNRADANHRYITDKTIRDEMVAKGWLAEGDGPDLVTMCAPQ